MNQHICVCVSMGQFQTNHSIFQFMGKGACSGGMDPTKHELLA